MYFTTVKKKIEKKQVKQRLLETKKSEKFITISALEEMLNNVLWAEEVWYQMEMWTCAR